MQSKGIEFISFIRKFKTSILFSFICTFICYWTMVTNYTLSIDEDTWINGTSNILSWVAQGRFGLYIFNRIFIPSGIFVPMLWDILAIICWVTAGIITLYALLSLVQKLSRFSAFAFCTVFPTVPFVFGDWLSFSMFNFQQGLAIIVMAMGILCTTVFFEKRKIRFLTLSSFLVFVSTSFYQAYIVVYITAMAVYFFLYVLVNSDVSIKNLAKDIGISAIVCATAFVGYYLVNLFSIKVILHQDEIYGTFLMGWDQYTSVGHAFRSIISSIVNILLGNGLIGSTAQKVIIFLFIFAMIAIIINNKGKKRCLLLIAFAGIMLIAPFSLQLVLGSFNLDGRIYLGLPLLFASIVMIISDFVPKKQITSIIVSAAIIFVIFCNAASLNNLYYNCHLRYQYDKQTAGQIMNELKLNHYNYKDKPVIFVGMLDAPTRGDKNLTPLGSFFEWDNGNNGRILNFMYNESYILQGGSSEQKLQGAQMAVNMPNWPEDGCIQETDEIIIIKFSDPTQFWYKVNT